MFKPKIRKAEVSKAVSKLRYKLSDRRRHLKNVEGSKGRHDKIRKVVTALFKHERIELNYNLGDESRGYAERLISDAIRHGPNHKETMEMASYWLTEKQIVHKLFKVLVPRFEKFPLSYTKMWKAPNVNPRPEITTCVLELRNNIYPPLGPDRTNNKNLIHNVLLREAKKYYEKQKMLKLREENSQMKEILNEVPREGSSTESAKEGNESGNSEQNISKMGGDVSDVQNSIADLKLSEEGSESSLKSSQPVESNLNSSELKKESENKSNKTDSSQPSSSNESESPPEKKNL